MTDLSGSNTTLILSWIGLVALSIISVAAGNFEYRLLAGVIVLAAGFSKAWIIIDCFMELRHARRFWRYMLIGWPVAMAMCIGLSMASRLPPQ